MVVRGIAIMGHKGHILYIRVIIFIYFFTHTLYNIIYIFLYSLALGF